METFNELIKSESKFKQPNKSKMSDEEKKKLLYDQLISKKIDSINRKTGSDDVIDFFKNKSVDTTGMNQDYYNPKHGIPNEWLKGKQEINPNSNQGDPNLQNQKSQGIIKDKYLEDFLRVQKGDSKKPDEPAVSVVNANPVEKKPKEDEGFDWRRLGIALAGGLSSYGDAMLGQGTSGAANRMFGNLENYDKTKELNVLKNPGSAESIKARELMSNFYPDKAHIFKNMSAYQLKESAPNLYKQAELEFERNKLSVLERHKNIRKGQSKQSKELHKDVNEHLNLIDSSIQNLDAVKKLNRKPGGSVFGDYDKDTIAIANQIDKNSIAEAKMMAGVGTFSDADQKAYIPLTLNSKDRMDVAMSKGINNIKTASEKAINKLINSVQTGDLDSEQANRYLNLYDTKLRKIGMHINLKTNSIEPLGGK